MLHEHRPAALQWWRRSCEFGWRGWNRVYGKQSGPEFRRDNVIRWRRAANTRAQVCFLQCLSCLVENQRARGVSHFAVHLSGFEHRRAGRGSPKWERSACSACTCEWLFYRMREGFQSHHHVIERSWEDDRRIIEGSTEDDRGNIRSAKSSHKICGRRTKNTWPK
jgi:hypothetical protein